MQKEVESRIFSLYARNIKMIKEVDITAEGNILIIEGKNQQGKTSIMDCISYALGGKALIPKDPIRHGQDRAKIEIKDTNGLKISRTWTAPDKSYLKIEAKDGYQPSNPQEYLNDLLGSVSFDPLEFATMEKEPRVQLMKRITGLDFTEMDAKYQELYDQRRMYNRDLKARQTELEGYRGIKVPEDVRPIEDIQADIEKAQAHNKKIDDAAARMQQISTQANGFRKSKKNAEAEIERLKGQITASVQSIEKLTIEYQEQKKIAEQDTMSLDVSTEMQKARDAASVIARIERRNKVRRDIEKLEHIITSLQEEIDTIQKDKADKITAAQMPIEGLTFNTNEVFYNEVELSQVSQAEKIKIGMSIAIAENPKLRIIRIMDGSLLDKDSMLEIKRMAQEHRFQVWIERVADEKSGDKDAVYIEDGTVK